MAGPALAAARHGDRVTEFSSRNTPHFAHLPPVPPEFTPPGFVHVTTTVTSEANPTLAQLYNQATDG